MARRSARRTQRAYERLSLINLLWQAELVAHSNMPQDALDDFHYYSLIISPTFKIPELTKPVVELTLPSGSGGENSFFDPAANTLIIQYQTPTTTLYGWLRIHAPDVGGSAALILALLIFFLSVTFFDGHNLMATSTVATATMTSRNGSSPHRHNQLASASNAASQHSQSLQFAADS